MKNKPLIVLLTLAPPVSSLDILLIVLYCNLLNYQLPASVLFNKIPLAQYRPVVPSGNRS